MKSRGLLFSSPMVRALLAGTKTQTRRMLNPQPTREAHGLIGHRDLAGHFGEHVFGYCMVKCAPCPYGSAGDRLWVREGWRTAASLDELQPSAIADSVPIHYESDGTIRGRFREAVGRYRHARFMPRAFSRIDLEVTEIRVQRLLEITEEDARAEGVEPFFTRFPHIGRDQRITDGRYARDEEHRASYACLWDEINGDAALWNTNPWVWAITFKRVEASR